MKQETYPNGAFARMLTKKRLSRRGFLIGAGTSVAALSAPIYLSNTPIPALAASQAATLPPPIIFAGNGIGAQFNSYAQPATPYSIHFAADEFDRTYFPGQKAQLTLTLANAGGPPPSPWQGHDIGTVSGAGSVAYANGQFTITGGGGDIWTGPDGFHFVAQPLTGDGEIVAYLSGFQAGDSWAKAGLMIRETLDPNAAFVDVIVTGGNGVRAQFRDATNGLGDEHGSDSMTSATAPYWLKLKRAGNVITCSASSDGTTWAALATVNSPIANNAFIGLFSCSHGAGLATATYSHVSVNGVAVEGNGDARPIEVSGTLTVAYATEVVGDNNGGVQLTPVEVSKAYPIATTSVAPGSDAKLSFTYDFTDSKARKGIYAIFAELEDSTKPGEKKTIWLGNIGLIYPPASGFKEHSFFMGDTRSDEPTSYSVEVKTLRKMGVKWTRFGQDWSAQEPQKGVYDWAYTDRALEIFKTNEIYMLWLALGSPDWARDGQTYHVRTNSSAPNLAIPDNHLADYQQYWVEFTKHYKGSIIKAINVWNEPWEGGGISGWGGTGQTYRHMIKAVYDGVKSVDPTVLVGGDDSDDNINDILYCVPEWKELFDLGTQHGGGPGGYYMQRLLPFPVWNTESWYFAQSGQIVQETLFAIAGGRSKVNNVVLGNFYTGAGDAGGYYSYNPDSQFSPQPSLAAYATMTHFLEDTQFVEEPHADRVPFVFLFKGQKKHVAVAFGFPTNSGWVPQWQVTGPGKMYLPDPLHLIEAYDTYGNLYKREANGGYILPFNITPVYLVAASQGILREATQALQVTATNTPVRIVVDDLTRQLTDAPELPITITNLLPQRLSGTVQVTLPTGWQADKTSFTFHGLEAGQSLCFHAKLSKATANEQNQYPVSVTVTTPVGTMVWKESIEVHVIGYGTPHIGQGSAQDEWKRLGITPILLGKPTDSAYAQVGLSYDEQNLYFVAVVTTPTNNPPVDQLGTWYTLIPPGYGYADGPNWAFAGDNLQLALNCYDNKEDYLYPKNHPYHYRYPSRETDYLFGFYQPKGTNGQVWRYRMPGMPWRHRYPFTPANALQQVVDTEVKLTMTASGTTLTYWAVLPLSHLSKLHAGPKEVIKLAVKHANANSGDVYSSQGRSSSRNDAQAFQPYWAGAYSVDTLWGFGKKPTQ